MPILVLLCRKCSIFSPSPDEPHGCSANYKSGMALHLIHFETMIDTTAFVRGPDTEDNIFRIKLGSVADETQSEKSITDSIAMYA